MFGWVKYFDYRGICSICKGGVGNKVVKFGLDKIKRGF